MKILKLLQITILSTVVLFLFSSTSYAMEIVGRDSIKLDDALAEKEILFSQPRKIYITQVHSNNRNIKNDTKAWIRSIYYYSITRLKLNDIPYNYLIDKSGNVYEVSKGGVGANPGLEAGDNIVLIGILDNNTALTPRTESSLVELVETLSYRYGIKQDGWDFVNLKIVSNENERSYLRAESSKTSTLQSVSQALAKVRWSDKEHLDYKASIEKVEYSQEVEVGQKLEVKVTIKNENDFPWFGDVTYIYVSTKDAKESAYAINSVWESFSRPTYIKDRVVKPGDTTEVIFSLMGKSRPGEYKEVFVFTKDETGVFEGSEFEVVFKIIAGEKKLVEVVSPQYGFVNIRECRWFSCKKVEVANHGDVFIMNKKEEGWYEIIFNESDLGWVTQQYIREL
ncbi:hypothetical protein CVU76_00690 [Candidatus Dojkabacteria bacterium HGW-Dojkabacteria-1]|uniref:Uncharacterized protein n=1 Tax=Candidatus Dojkabacteria bacterium HGW-Dojkabacteria-1 TaxID=2013761 RepID=A0A2N2F321_9BACT|nr:MAG: hypothetical protein CVU76_00690 [Candidatus Dojkabacteria bacterium HGW-Dojkabacteria-1]